MARARMAPAPAFADPVQTKGWAPATLLGALIRQPPLTPSGSSSAGLVTCNLRTTGLAAARAVHLSDWWAGRCGESLG